MAKLDTARVMFEIGMREEDERMVPEVVYPWVKMALPDKVIEDIPLEVLLSLYPNIVRLGPQGDELMGLVDDYLFVLEHNSETARLLANYMKRFYTQHGKAFFVELNAIEYAGKPLALRTSRLDDEQRAAVKTTSLTAYQLGARLATLARIVSTSYAASKGISMNDDDAIKVKLGFESMTWILTLESGVLPELAEKASHLYSKVNKFVARVSESAKN